MITIKNIRPSILIIPDAGLKLTPGQSETVAQLTSQMKDLLESGHLAQVEQTAKPSALKSKEKMDLSKLAAPEAISKVHEEADPVALKGYMENESRKTVLDAMKERLQEIDGGKA